MVKQKSVDEPQEISDIHTSESEFAWLEETDAEFSERLDKAEQEMLEGKCVDLSYFCGTSQDD